MFDVIIYHENCSDGISSAWVANKMNEHEDCTNSIILPCAAGKNPHIFFENLRGKRVLFCDICPTPEYLDSLAVIVNKITIIDHHVAALENIKPICEKYDNINVYRSDDKEKSGCILTWEYCFPSVSPPWFLEYISDRDTWSWKLPNSEAINSAMFQEKWITFSGLEKMYDLHGYDLDRLKNDLIEKGNQIMEFKRKTVDLFVNKADLCKYKNYNVWLYNCLPEYRSDVGNALLKRNISAGIAPDFAVAWHYDIPSGDFWLSLRSDDSKPDVCAIAKEIAENGGGHRNAAGVTVYKNSNIQLNQLFRGTK